MAHSADEPEERRGHRADSDPGYEVLPGPAYEALPDAEPEDRYGPEVRRRRRRETAEDRKSARRPRPRRKARPPRDPVLIALGLATAVAALAMGLLAIAGLAIFVVSLIGGRLRRRLLFGSLVLFGILAAYYGRVAWAVWAGRGVGLPFGQVTVVSLAVAGFIGLFTLPALMFGVHMGDPSSAVLWVGLGGALVDMLLIAITVLAGLVAYRSRS